MNDREIAHEADVHVVRLNVGDRRGRGSVREKRAAVEHTSVRQDRDEVVGEVW